VHELRLRVAAAHVEDVLDVVLPLIPGGVHIRQQGEEAELAIVIAPGTPDAEELRRAAAPHLIDLRAGEAPDGWRERRLARYEPLIVADRVLIRPEWAPAASDSDLIEIALGESGAFGSGVHPTTQASLALLCGIDPGGAFADFGCGSGILAIAAAKLGFSPVVAIDVDEASLLATRRNAAANGVEVGTRRLDLTSEPAPVADTVAANVPPQVHLGLASALGRAPTRAVVSGFKPTEAEAVTAAWSRHGLAVAKRLQVGEWTTLLLR